MKEGREAGGKNGKERMRDKEGKERRKYFVKSDAVPGFRPVSKFEFPGGKNNNFTILETFGVISKIVSSLK